MQSKLAVSLYLCASSIATISYAHTDSSTDRPIVKEADQNKPNYNALDEVCLRSLKEQPGSQTISLGNPFGGLNIPICAASPKKELRLANYLRYFDTALKMEAQFLLAGMPFPVSCTSLYNHSLAANVFSNPDTSPYFDKLKDKIKTLDFGFLEINKLSKGLGDFSRDDLKYALALLPKGLEGNFLAAHDFYNLILEELHCKRFSEDK